MSNNRYSILRRVENTEGWLMTRWRPVAAMVYLFICLVDFVAMPIYFEYSHARLTPERVADIAIKFNDGATQVEAMRVLRADRAWEPLTLRETGLFHIAFGAILGVAAWKQPDRPRRPRNDFKNDGTDDSDVR